ncbi:MAG: FeoA family protein [Candidatus Hinthialibacter sp.]
MGQTKTADEKQLRNCGAGCAGIITKIEGDTDALARLQELGLLPGQWIKIIRAGNPTIFDIAGSRYCARAHQLQGVSVHLVPGDPLSAAGIEPLFLSKSCSPVQTAKSDL